MTATREPRPAKARTRPKAAPVGEGEEQRIPDPLELDAAEAARRPEFYGFDIVPPPDRPPQTEREREVYTLGDGEMLVNMGPQHPSTHGVMRARAQGPGRDRHRHGPGPGLPPPRHREAVRERHLHHGHDLRRPHGLHVGHAQRARAGHRLREAVRDQGSAPGGVHPGAGGGAEPGLQPRPDDGLPGPGPRWHDPHPVQLHQPRPGGGPALRHLAASGCCSTSSGSAA